jgi:CheY-like chemotaxis protein
MNTSRPLILAIEADPDRRRQLAHLLHERVNADVALVDSASAAARAIAFRPPDLVVASMLLPPSDDAQMMAHLNTLDEASRPPVIVVPPLHEPDSPSVTRRLLHRLGLRRLAPFPLYDADAIGLRIHEALHDADDSPPPRVTDESGHRRPGAVAVRRPPSAALAPKSAVVEAPIVLPPKQIVARAHRWDPAELPWVCSVKAPVGLDARVLNISRSGILIETGSKLAPGGVASVYVTGVDTALMVPARVVRSEVASVEAAGVKYRIAASFTGRLDVIPEDAVRPEVTSLASPRTLAELLARAFADVDRGVRREDVTATFEHGVQQLVSGYDVKIRETPAPITNRESIYFQVPVSAGSPAVLQVSFDPGHRPAPDEFKLMKAAAAAAGLVMGDARRVPSAAPSHHRRRNSW